MEGETDNGLQSLVFRKCSMSALVCNHPATCCDCSRDNSIQHPKMQVKYVERNELHADEETSKREKNRHKCVGKSKRRAALETSCRYNVDNFFFCRIFSAYMPSQALKIISVLVTNSIGASNRKLFPVLKIEQHSLTRHLS